VGNLNYSSKLAAKLQFHGRLLGDSMQMLKKLAIWVFFSGSVFVFCFGTLDLRGGKNLLRITENSALMATASGKTIRSERMVEAKNFDYLIGKIKGLSEKQLKAHFGLYQGYVKKTNEIEQKLATADRSTANYSYGEVSELMRRHAVAYNGAYLHQYYFENLTGEASQPSGELKQALEKHFGSMEKWVADVKAGLTSAPGWVLLTRSRRDGSLRNVLLEEHHRGLIVDQDILLALDGWEHAYMIDYGTAKPEYSNALLAAIDWQVAARRLEQSIKGR